MSPVQTHEEQLQEKRVEKMMRAAAKDVHKIRGQSRKEVPEVQTFRYKTGKSGGVPGHLASLAQLSMKMFFLVLISRQAQSEVFPCLQTSWFPVRAELFLTEVSLLVVCFQREDGVLHAS